MTVQNGFKQWLVLLMAPGLIGISYYYYRTWYHSAQHVAPKKSAVHEQKQDLSGSTQACGAVDGALVKERAWSELQSLTKDTVVQVIAQVAQFDWLEPYKTPAQGQGSGSAFFINDKGELITNAHVVNQSKAVFVQIPTFGKRRFEVDVVAISPERDLALLRLKPDDVKLLKEVLKRVPVLTLGDSDKVTRAQEIMTLGYPLGQNSLKSTTGVVSGRERINGQYMIQISAPINPGNSGGPSLDRCGFVIGVNSVTALEAQNVNYIIPSNEVELFLHQIERLQDNGKIKFLRRPTLGLIYNNANDDLASYLGNPVPSGLYVVDTPAGSPLYKAGVQSGDMIYEIDGYRLDEFGEMNVASIDDKMSITDYISRLLIGDTVKLKVYRKGKELNLSFILDQTEPMAIRRMFPGYEPMDYEIIGGMVIMPLSLNHVQILIPAAPELTRYAELKNQLEPALIITHVMPDSAVTRARIIGLGAVLSEINGTPVKTLADFRAALKKSVKNDMVVVKTTENTIVAFPLKRMLMDEKKLSESYYYKITPHVQELIRECCPQETKA